LTDGMYPVLVIMLNQSTMYSVSAVPIFPGLQWFPDGQDFTQLTGDDSKALMKVSVVIVVIFQSNTHIQSRFISLLLLALFLMIWLHAFPTS
jgi:hypothetical protein